MRLSHAAAWIFERMGLDVALAGDCWRNARGDVRSSGIGDRC